MAASVLHYTPMTTIKLSGSLARKFGRVHRFMLGTGDVREAVKAIDANHPGFAKALASSHADGLEYAVFRNRRNIGQQELELGGAREIRIVPVLRGSKRGGVMQTVIGAVLVVVGAALSYFSVGTLSGFGIGMMQMGGAMMLGGVIQMMSPQPKGLSTSAGPENMPSYAFGSARNTTASGNPVPFCAGDRRWGGAIISAGIYAEDQL